MLNQRARLANRIRSRVRSRHCGRGLIVVQNPVEAGVAIEMEWLASVKVLPVSRDLPVYRSICNGHHLSLNAGLEVGTLSCLSRNDVWARPSSFPTCMLGATPRTSPKSRRTLPTANHFLMPGRHYIAACT